MRLLVAILIIWLFLFYNIERLSAPINITNVAYTFVPLMAILTLLVPRLRKAPLWALLLVPIPVFLVTEAWIKSSVSVGDTSLALKVTEICAVLLTTILAYRVSNGVDEFESAVAHITIGQAARLPEQFSTGQAEMYREVKRARHHQRPLSLMAIGVDKKSIQIALDRMVQEVQQAMMKQYVLSDIARMLCDELEDYNVIAQRNDHFLVLLPETSPEQLNVLVGRLRRAVSEQVGVTLQIGTASLPKDAVTFESLVESAVGEMNGEPQAEPALRPQWLTTEQHTA